MIVVVLPALNEAATIATTVTRLAEVASRDRRTYRIVLVDDGSTDRTADVAREAAEGRVELSVLRHEANRGLGAAIRTGLYATLDHADDDDAIVMLDADDTHPPDLIPRMANLVSQGYDVVIASRYQRGARVIGVPAARRALSELARRVFGVAFPIAGVRDYTCGYRCYGVRALRRARHVYGDELCTQRGFEATVDLLLRLRQVGISAAEVPLELNYGPRVGHSKMRVWRTVKGTLALVGRRLFERATTYRTSRVRALLETHRAEQLP